MSDTNCESEFACSINDLPNEILLKIFKKLTVFEALNARLVSLHWYGLISGFIRHKIKISVNARSLRYRDARLEDVIKIFDRESNVETLMLVGMHFLGPLNLHLHDIGQQIRQLKLVDVEINVMDLFQCLNGLEQLQTLSLLNCYILNSKCGQFTSNLLPRLQEIEVDFIKTQCKSREIWSTDVLENLLRNNNAKLSLKIKVLFYDNVEEANFIMRFGSRLKKLHIEMIHPKILEQLYMNKDINLTDLTILGSTQIAPSTILKIVDAQLNLETLLIHPRIFGNTQSFVQEIEQKFKHLKQIVLTFNCWDIDQDINFLSVESLGLTYYKKALRNIHAPALKQLKICPNKINQKSVDLIHKKFSFLTKLSVSITHRKYYSSLNFENCFTNLEHLQEFELIDQSQNVGSANMKTYSSITLFGSPNPEEQSSMVCKLKKLKIEKIYIDIDQFKLIFKRCPRIEDLSLVKCGFCYIETLNAIKLICDMLKNLRTFSYTHENYPENIPPNSIMWLLDHCPTLESVKFDPEVSLEGNSLPQTSRLFYDFSASIHSIRDYYNLRDMAVKKANEIGTRNYKRHVGEVKHSAFYNDSSSDEENENKNESERIVKFIKKFNEFYKKQPIAIPGVIVVSDSDEKDD